MGDVTPIQQPGPSPSVVCGYPVALVDGAWWAFRPGSRAWQRRTGTYWRPIVGPEDSREEAERGARRFALRPLRRTEVKRDRAS